MSRPALAGAELEPGDSRLAPMHTPSRPGRLLAGVGLALATILAGCSSAAVPPSSTPPNQTATPPATGHAPGGLQPDDPISTDAPPAGGAPGVPPVAGRVVIPRPGQLDVHSIAAGSLSASVDGRHVVVEIDYTSGVEPCNVLDSIVVQRGEGSFAITLREGHGPGDTVCIEIAEFKRALVDLGELSPGTYTISDAAGGAAPITVTVN
jgi:hypothetical protein